MEREAFVQFLARCVADGILSEGDAADLILRYDMGELGDGWELPVAPEDNQGVDGAALAGALLGLLAYLATQRVRTQDMTPAQITLSGTIDLGGGVAPVRILRNLGNVDRLITGLQTGYEGQARGLATALAEGRISVAQWQLGMEGAIQSHIVQQMAAGGGSTVLTPRQWADVERIMAEQNAYLGRFSDTIALRRGMGAPLSEAYIANRAESYGGIGRGLGYSEAEGAMLADGTLNGYVCDYISRDDSATCVNCLQAQREGPYLPGAGPYPGQICLGRNRCRCRREYRYDPDAYRRLGGV